MLRSFYIASLIATALVAAPTAMADSSPVTIELDLNPAALVTDEGFEATMKAVEYKAQIACSYQKPLTRTPETDELCVEEAMANAKVQLRQIAQTVSGTVIADKS